MLEFALQTAWRELVAKHGTPLSGPPPAEAGFAVIGYGKLGGLELGYGSDLDLVFLHDSRGAQQETTAARRSTTSASSRGWCSGSFISCRSKRARAGSTRWTRGCGRAAVPGCSFTRLDGFHQYQTQEAWVWEHQALLRSRALAGSRRVCDEFERMRRDVLVAHVNRAKLKTEVVAMRRRMRDELSLAKKGGFDIKQDPGGIADIEFLVDYWVLASSARVSRARRVSGQHASARGARARGARAARALPERMKDAYLALRAAHPRARARRGGPRGSGARVQGLASVGDRACGTRYSPAWRRTRHCPPMARLIPMLRSEYNSAPRA